MALFKGKSKEEKEAEKLRKLNDKMKKYNLENLSVEDKEQVKLILMSLFGNSTIELGLSLSLKNDDGKEAAKLSYLGALVEQNWLIIKLLNEIKGKLDKQL